jgi:hypothetical protein
MMYPSDSKVNHPISRYGRVHGQHPEESGDYRSYADLAAELGDDVARELAREFNHIGLDGRGVADAATVEELLRLRERRQL